MNMSRFTTMMFAAAVFLLVSGGTISRAADKDKDNDGPSGCKQLPSHDALRKALVSAQAQANGGFGLNMWGTIVNRDGVVCSVALPEMRVAISGREVV